MSLPSWERGLKYLKKLPVVGSDHVAPLVGAWIEMMLSPKRFPEPVVAPLVGAWIEISKGMSASEWIKSLPSWERGLKSFSASLSRNENTVAPLVGAWIEISSTKACSSP